MPCSPTILSVALNFGPILIGQFCPRSTYVSIVSKLWVWMTVPQLKLTDTFDSAAGSTRLYVCDGATRIGTFCSSTSAHRRWQSYTINTHVINAPSSDSQLSSCRDTCLPQQHVIIATTAPKYRTRTDSHSCSRWLDSAPNRSQTCTLTDCPPSTCSSHISATLMVNQKAQTDIRSWPAPPQVCQAAHTQSRSATGPCIVNIKS